MKEHPFTEELELLEWKLSNLVQESTDFNTIQNRDISEKIRELSLEVVNKFYGVAEESEESEEVLVGDMDTFIGNQCDDGNFKDRFKQLHR